MSRTTTCILRLEPGLDASITRDVIPEMLYIARRTRHAVHCSINQETYTVKPGDALFDVERRYPHLKELRKALEETS